MSLFTKIIIENILKQSKELWILCINPLMMKYYLKEWILRQLSNRLKHLKCFVKIQSIALQNVFETERDYHWKVCNKAYVFLLRKVDSKNFIAKWKDVASKLKERNENVDNESDKSGSESKAPLLEFDAILVNKTVKYEVIDAGMITPDCKDITFQETNEFENEMIANESIGSSHNSPQTRRNPNLHLFRNQQKYDSQSSERKEVSLNII